MHKLNRRIASLILAALILCGGFPSASAYSHPDGLWQHLDAWNAAVAANDYAAIRDMSWTLMALYEGESLCLENCSMRSNVTAAAAEAYRQSGDLDTALYWLEQQLIYDNWIAANHNSGYQDRIIAAEALIRALSVDVDIYTTAWNPADVPYYGVVGEPEVGMLHGTNGNGSTTFAESATLIYVDFGTGSAEYWFNYFRDNNAKSGDILGEDRVVVMAWNFPFQGGPTSPLLTGIINGEYDDYIRETARYLNTLDCEVILRIGGEMNDLDGMDGGEFAAAFRRVVTITRQYSSNTASLFSPVAVGKWGKTYSDYYPGDDYVDWVGLSLYFYYQEPGSDPGVNAYYNMAEFSRNPLYYIGLLTDQFPGKPILISESGGGHYSFTNGADYTDYAVERLDNYLAYVSMVYPQVKGTMYFDQSVNGDAYDYRLSTNDKLKSTYTNRVTSGNYLATADSAVKGYTRLATMNEATDTLELYVNALLPTEGQIAVDYYLDGSHLATTTSTPHRYTLNVGSLSVGEHTVQATVKGGNLQKTTATRFYVGADGTIIGEEQYASAGRFTDVPINEWYYDWVYSGVEYGLISGRSSTIFAPGDSITRAEFLTLLHNLAEKMGLDTTGTVTGEFLDVDYDEWYGPVVGWACANGIATGYSSTSFGPDNSITRQEIAAMLVNFTGYAEIELEAQTAYTGYGDAGEIATWARDAVEAVTRAGIMEGSGGNFHPGQAANRAEAATLAVRFYQQYIL